MYHIVFIHAPVGACLNYIHISPIVNDAAMNIGMHAAFQIRAICPGVGLQGHVVALFLVFQGIFLRKYF